MPSVPDATAMGPSGGWVECMRSCPGPCGRAVLRGAGAASLRQGGRLLHGAPYAKQRGSSAGVKVGGPQLNHGREGDLSLLQMEDRTERFGWVRVLGREGGQRRKPDFLLPPETSAAPSADKKSRASDSWG